MPILPGIQSSVVMPPFLPKGRSGSSREQSMREARLLPWHCMSWKVPGSDGGVGGLPGQLGGGGGGGRVGGGVHGTVPLRVKTKSRLSWPWVKRNSSCVFALRLVSFMHDFEGHKGTGELTNIARRCPRNASGPDTAGYREIVSALGDLPVLEEARDIERFGESDCPLGFGNIG